jgi:two-component system, response regulator PdtaR
MGGPIVSASLRILVVEDEALVALKLEDDLFEAGHTVVGRAASSAQALRLAAERAPDLVLVDIDLADGPTGVALVEQLKSCGSMIVLYVTANARRIPEDFGSAAGAIGKPYTAHGLGRAIAFMASMLDEGAVPPPPPGLRLAPALRPAGDGRYRFRRASAGSSH